MLPWTPFERRWRDAVLAAVLPGCVASPAFWREWSRAATPLLRLGLRVSVWALTLSPLAFLRPRLLHHLPGSERDRVLARLATHRVYLVRQLVLTVKLTAGFAALSDPERRREVTG